MIRHILITVYRNFKRYKTSFLINLAGLSTGLACALFIYLWIVDEKRIDGFHEKGNRIVQIVDNRHFTSGIKTGEYTTGQLEAALPEAFPEIESAAAVIPLYRYMNVTISHSETNIKTGGQFAGKNYFTIFSFPLLHGNASQVLADKHNIVLSEKLALRLFKSTDNIIGKTVSFRHEDNFVVSGVFKDIPPHSSSRFDFVLPFDYYKEKNSWIMDWRNASPYTYVLLKEHTDLQQFNKKLYGFMKSKVPDLNSSLLAVPFPEVYLRDKYENGVRAGGRIEYVHLFSVIAIVILLIACINFMNLSTAKASRKLKEVGVKKAIGADRKYLILQYLGESVFLSFLSLILALLIMILFLQQFNQITGKELSLHLSIGQIFAIAGITFLTGLVAGSYPAFYLSGFTPVQVLKGNVAGSVKELIARKGLVVLQFSLSVIFIVSVVVIYRQMEYIQNKNLGYNKENILCVNAEGALYGEKGQLKPFIEEAKHLPGVIAASSIGNKLIGDNSNTSGISWEGKKPGEEVRFQSVTVNYHLLEMLGVDFVEGHSYSPDRRADSTKIIFNEAAIRAMGLKDPVGKIVDMWGNRVEILGVVKDFHFESFHENIEPMVFRLVPPDVSVIMIKIHPGKETSVIHSVQELYQKLNPGFSFDYHFLDEDYQAQYVAEKRILVLSKYFAFLAIQISCLGLFGLAVFSAEKRSREIGIRKVLGASEYNILLLLTSEFTKTVLVAIALAIPLSYFLTQSWLNSFAYRTELQWWYFILPASVALLIAWLTVGIQGSLAARVNPARSLKSE